VAEIIASLITTHKEGKKFNVSKLKSDIAAKYRLSEQPKTVDIIAAIPDNYRAALLPVLKTKPVRTASGVRICIWW
jgi:elongator complex protein 3